MKKIKFYQCPTCGNLLTATGSADLSCCGRLLAPLVAQPADEAHKVTIEEVEDDLYVTFAHEMRKTHYLSFFAYATCDRVLLMKLYPEQSGEVRFQKKAGATLYYGCNQHGLFLCK